MPALLCVVVLGVVAPGESDACSCPGGPVLLPPAASPAGLLFRDAVIRIQVPVSYAEWLMLNTETLPAAMVVRADGVVVTGSVRALELQDGWVLTHVPDALFPAGAHVSVEVGGPIFMELDVSADVGAKVGEGVTLDALDIADRQRGIRGGSCDQSLDGMVLRMFLGGALSDEDNALYRLHIAPLGEEVPARPTVVVPGRWHSAALMNGQDCVRLSDQACSPMLFAIGDRAARYCVRVDVEDRHGTVATMGTLCTDGVHDTHGTGGAAMCETGPPPPDAGMEPAAPAEESAPAHGCTHAAAVWPWGALGIAVRRRRRNGGSFK